MEVKYKSLLFLYKQLGTHNDEVLLTSVWKEDLMLNETVNIGALLHEKKIKLVFYMLTTVTWEENA